MLVKLVGLKAEFTVMRESEDVRALVIEGPQRAAIKEVPYPNPKPGEVTVQVKRVGICGTDLHIYKGEFISPYPIIPGHEFSGVVHEVGEGVSGLSVGDRVCVDPSIFCGACSFCLTKRGNHCEHWGATGVTVNGSMAEFVSVPARNAIKMPDEMSFAIGAFVEPMACVVHAMNQLELQVGQRVLLFGAGAMGQQLVQALARAGAAELVVVDVSESKLSLAKEWGATKTVLSRNVEAELGRQHYPFGFDVVVDATGIPAVIEQALGYMGRAAKFLQFGVTSSDASIRLNPFELYHKDWKLIGSMAINHTFLPALEWVNAGRVKLDHLISKVMTLEEGLAYIANPNRDPNLLKVQIDLDAM